MDRNKIEGPIRLPLLLSSKEIAYFELYHYRSDGKKYQILVKGDIRKGDVLIRIESACTYVHLYGSQFCDCEWQLKESLKKIRESNKGIFIYALDQHGRGIGFDDHIRVYMQEQKKNLDTVEAHKSLGLEADPRDYSDIVKILKHFSVSSLKLLTNNPQRIKFLKSKGFKVKRVPLEAEINEYNIRELSVKREKMDHILPKIDEYWMKYAIRLAKDKGRVTDKPLVGAVVVKSGKKIGEGYGVQGTHVHAEIMAIRKAGENAKNATLYTTLEPCIEEFTKSLPEYYPSCMKEILKAGIKRVVIGAIDPHPLVNGRGMKQLKENNVETAIVLEKESRDLITDYIRKYQNK